MKIIKRLVGYLEEELDGAQKYAEKHVEYKANDNSKWSSRFKSMSEDELAHAMNIHELIAEEIEKLNKVYQPSQEMFDKWESAHKEYVERASWIKQMLSL